MQPEDDADTNQNGLLGDLADSQYLALLIMITIDFGKLL
jgi:hypothetical protein